MGGTSKTRIFRVGKGCLGKRHSGSYLHHQISVTHRVVHTVGNQRRHWLIVGRDDNLIECFYSVVLVCFTAGEVTFKVEIVDDT